MKIIKEFVKRHSKKLVVSAVMASMMVMTAISAFAQGAEVEPSGGDSLRTSFSSALNTIQSDVLSYIGLALPVALAVFGAIIAIKKGISFVRSLIGR